MEALIMAAASSATSAGITAAAGSTIGPVTASALAGTTGGQLGTFLAGSGGSLISSGLTGLSAGGQILGGFQESAVARAQAQQAELAARTEELKGREQADKIRRSLQATLASQTAGFAARGIQPGVGTPARLAGVSATEAARDIEVAQFGAGTAAEAERLRARQFKLQGRSAITKGFASGFGSLIA